MHATTRKNGSFDINLGWHDRKPEKAALGFVNEEPVTNRPRRKPYSLSDYESHLVTIAPTGAGKGRSAIIPTCLEYPGSMLVIDPKGEATAVSARRRRELGNEVVVIDPFGITSEPAATFNPFDVLDETDMSGEEFSLLFPTLLHPERDYSRSREPFWDLRGDDLIAGICAYLLSAASEDIRNMQSLRRLIRNDDVPYNLAKLLDQHGRNMSAMAYENIASFVSTDDRCRSGILATAQQHFCIYADPKVEKSLSDTSFDLNGFKEGKPMTIYLVLPVTRLRSHSALLRIWTSSLLALIKSRTQKPELSTLLLIDEAAQLGRLSSLVECIPLLRGYGVRTWTFWQSQKQLFDLYGNDADVILDNCGVIQCLECNNHRNAAGMCELLGHTYTPLDLLTLSAKEQLIMGRDGEVERTLKLDYLKDRKYQSHYDTNPMYTHASAARNKNYGRD